MTQEQFFNIKLAVARNRSKKKFKDSSIAIYKAAIEEVMGYHYEHKLRTIGALRRDLSFENTLKYIEAPFDPR